MMKRIFTGGMLTESNSFAPFPTGYDDFKARMFLRRGEGVAEPKEEDLCRTFIEKAQARGWQVCAGLRCFAQPAGPVIQSAYEALRDELLEDLRQAMPVDAVLLSLHGAMVADQEDDGEGDILERVRQLVGEAVPIGVHCDPHCHLTRRMVDNADVIKIWKEYPHTDIAERAAEVFDLIAARLEGAPRPIPVIHDCRMTQMFHTTREPMRSFVDHIIALEGNEGIQSISIAHSFPWGDVADLGTKVLVYADSPAALGHAQQLAGELGQQLWAMREEVAPRYLGVDAALERAEQAPRGPVVIADSPDNPGGGAPCDSTYFLNALLQREASDWALGYLYDPEAVRLAMTAGQGSRLRMRIGGKTCELSGAPVDVDCTVAAVVKEAPLSFAGLNFQVGPAVALDLGENRHVVLISVRNQTFSPDIFLQLGVSLDRLQTVVVKSSQHFHAAFSPLAADIIYAAPPGVVSMEFASLPYRKADRSIWPLTSADSGETAP